MSDGNKYPLRGEGIEIREAVETRKVREVIEDDKSVRDNEPVLDDVTVRDDEDDRRKYYIHIDEKLFIQMEESFRKRLDKEKAENKLREEEAEPPGSGPRVKRKGATKEDAQTEDKKRWIKYEDTKRWILSYYATDEDYELADADTDCFGTPHPGQPGGNN